MEHLYWIVTLINVILIHVECERIKPVASWTFTEYSNGKDLSEGGENPVTLKNVRYAPGPSLEPKSAVVLPSSGNQSMIVLNPNNKLRFSKNGFTYYTKVYLTGHTGVLFEYNTGITKSQDTDEPGNYLWVWRYNYNYKFSVGGSGFETSRKAKYNRLETYKWINIAAVYKKNSLVFYVDGKRVKSYRGKLELSQKGHIHMGYRPQEYGWVHNFLSGFMACAKFYDKPLDKFQVKDLSCVSPSLGLHPQFCHVCAKARSNEECNTVERCADNEVCYTLQEKKGERGDVTQFSKRCKKWHTCPPIDRTECNERGNKCHQCCVTDGCNKDVVDLFVQPVYEPVASWTFTSTSNVVNDLSKYGENPIDLASVEYGPGPDGEEGGSVFMPFSKEQAIIVSNPTNKLRFYYEMTYFTHVYVNDSMKGFVSGYNKGPLFEYSIYDGKNVGTSLWINPSNSIIVPDSGIRLDLPGVLTTNTWNRIATVWNETSVTVYVNGSLVGSKKGWTDLSGTHEGTLCIADKEQYYSSHLAGRMRCSKFFNVALPQDEILKLDCDTPNEESVANPNPVASWTFNSENGGRDLSPNGENPVTLTNIQYGPGPNGEPNGSVILPSSFNQSLVVIDPTDKLGFNETMTYFTRIYLTGLRGAFFVYNDGLNETFGTTGSYLFLWYNDTSLSVGKTGVQEYPVIAKHVVDHNIWTDIAVVWDTTSLIFYVDGSLVKSIQGATNLTQTQFGHLHFGYNPGKSSYDSFNNFLSGQMSCAKFYNEALTNIQDLSCD